jgi:DNA repair ATPase RecN
MQRNAKRGTKDQACRSVCLKRWEETNLPSNRVEGRCSTLKLKKNSMQVAGHQENEDWSGLGSTTVSFLIDAKIESN